MEQLLNAPVTRFLAVLGAAAMALVVIMIRIRAARYPASLRKVIIPPLAMSTGFLMFIFPITHIPFRYAAAAFVCGLVLALPLIWTTRFHMTNGEIYVRRSPAFMYVMLGLLAVRLLLHPIVDKYVTLAQSGALFFLLAFGMILLWRLDMTISYLKLTRKTHAS